jgi:hypothetical protein
MSDLKKQRRFLEIAAELAEIAKTKTGLGISTREGKLLAELKALEWEQDMESLGE